MSAGPGYLFFAQVQKEFHDGKKTKGHEAYKVFLNGMKSILDAKSGQEIGVRITQKITNQLVTAGAHAIPAPGVGPVVAWAAGKIVDKAADEFLKWLEGNGVTLDKIEYKFERSIGEAFEKVIHHSKMLEDANKDYESTYEDLKKVIGKDPVKTPPDPKALYKALKAMAFQFNALIWVWNKVHRDASAIIKAAESLETFAKDSAEHIKKEQELLLTLLDEILKENPGLALMGKK